MRGARNGWSLVPTRIVWPQVADSFESVIQRPKTDPRLGDYASTIETYRAISLRFLSRAAFQSAWYMSCPLGRRTPLVCGHPATQ